MSYPQVRLVNSPAASATVLFDFNDDTAAAKRLVLDAGFTLGVPTLEGDVDAVAPLYGPRTVSFTLRITGTKTNALAAQSALARRLLAGPGWLQVRLHSTSDLLFFRTYRAQPGDLSFERVMETSPTSIDDWDLEVNIACEPFAYGERETIAAQTVAVNPVAVTNPARLVLPAIKGDAPTPLDLVMTPSSSPNAKASWSVLAHASETARPTIHRSIGTGDGATAFNGTGAPVADAAYVGGSYREITFGDSTSQTRLTAMPNLTMVEGRYKVFLRVTPTATDSTFTLAVRGSTASISFNEVSVTLTGTAGTWVDMGTITVGRPAQSPNGPAGTTSHIALSSLIAARTAGTASLRVDHMVAIPIDFTDTIESREVRITPDLMAGGTFYIDGTYEEALSDSSTSIEATGSFVRAVPGVSNVLDFVFAVAPYATDNITRTVSTTIRYYPRWLYVGDS